MVSFVVVVVVKLTSIIIYLKWRDFILVSFVVVVVKLTDIITYLLSFVIAFSIGLNVEQIDGTQHLCMGILKKKYT